MKRARPWVLNPDQGYLLSANHRAAGDWYPMPLAGGSGSAGHGRRSARLLELMEALPETVEPEQVLDDVQNDCVNRVRRDLVALARHVAQVDDRYLTQDTLAFLDATAAWSATGGSMITDVEGVSLAYAINTKFRKDTIGDEMLNEYGGADNGLNLFLDTMQGEIDADPHFIPDLNELAYLNLALGDVWREFEERDIDVATMDEGYVQSASKDITLFASPLSGLGLDLTGVTIIGPTAACQDAGTIWSQHAQSYTQYVDFQSADSARAIMPPGNSENSDGEWFENQQDDWVDGTLLPAPLAPAFPTSNTPAVQLFWDAD